MLYVILVSLIILTIVQEHETKLQTVETEAVKRVDNLKFKSNREELEKVVEYLNRDNEITHEQRKHYAREKYDTEDLMNLLQKNYDVRTEQKNEVPEIRIHIIKNPAVLKKYLRSMSKKNTALSSDSDTSSSSGKDFDRVSDRYHARRNSAFRVQKDAHNDDSDIKVYTNSNIDVRLSSKNQKSHEDLPALLKTDYYKKGDSYEDEDAITGFKKKTKKRANDNDNTDDTWDIDVEKNFNKGSVDKKKHKRDWGEYNKDNGDNTAKSTAWVDEEVTHKTKDKKKNRSWTERDGNDWNEPKKERTDRDDNWDKPKLKKKEVNWVESHLKNEKRDSNNDRWSKITRNEWIESDRTTKKGWNRDIKTKKTASFNKPSFIASLPEYKHYGRERSESGFRGRTSIPFVGKKGIYDDN